MLNDADAAGVAEARFGVARGRRGVVLLVTVGTGVGTDGKATMAGAAASAISAGARAKMPLASSPAEATISGPEQMLQPPASSILTSPSARRISISRCQPSYSFRPPAMVITSAAPVARATPRKHSTVAHHPVPTGFTTSRPFSMAADSSATRTLSWKFAM